MHRGLVTCRPGTLATRRSRGILAAHRIARRSSSRRPRARGPCVGASYSDLDVVARLGEASDETAGSVAERRVCVVAPGRPLAHAARLMRQPGVAHVLVVDPASCSRSLLREQADNTVSERRLVRRRASSVSRAIALPRRCPGSYFDQAARVGLEPPSEEEPLMPTYLMLSTLTPQGVQTLKANPSRLREVNQDVEELGAKVLHQWATLGEYDFVNIVEAPDAATVAKISLALGARGSAKLQSLELVDIDTLMRSSARSDAAQRKPRGSRRSGSARRRQRALRQTRPRAALVVLLRRDVVRRVGMEERGEVLDLAAARPELELAAAVDLDPVRRAVVVEVEEPLHAAEARRLRVEAARRPLERLDVGDRVDREVPREPVAVRLEHGPRLVVDARVLEPRLRERLGDAAVELRRRRRVDPVAVVQALEVDDVDGAGRGELRDDLVRPLVARVELEADPGIEREQLLRRRSARRRT